MKFDIIIATYNREDSVNKLVSQILDCSIQPENIIIVDSSATENISIQAISKVKYIRSSHGNQPYQRYVGFLASKQAILIFFDDDMRVLNKNCFEIILSRYRRSSIVGVQPNFSSIHDFFDNKMPKSNFKQVGEFNNAGLKIAKAMSGYPEPKAGKFWLAGIKGAQPENMSSIEWFYGPVFSAKRELLYKKFNFRLFDIFQEKIGMGEDAILGFTLSTIGDICFLSEDLFHHEDQSDSTYSGDFISYGKRVAYSRLYLSFEYARLTNISSLFAFVHYNWYMLWRLTGLLLNQCVTHQVSRRDLITGMWSGWKMALQSRKELAEHIETPAFKHDAIIDAKS